MKPQHQANTNLLLSSFIWGLALGLAALAAGQFFANNALLHKILSSGGVFLSMLLYPLLVTAILRRKANLRFNIFFFSVVGGILSMLSTLLFSAFQDKEWTMVAICVIGAGFILQTSVSAFEKMLAVQREWSLPVWERLNDLSLLSFLLLQFPDLD